MIRFYRDEEKRYMVSDLLDADARQRAESIKNVTSSQFRNYFQELRALEARYRADLQKDPDGAWLRLEPQLRLFKAKLYYGARKDGPLANAEEFKSFLEETIDSIRDGRDFDAALLYVEAVLAYYYAEEQKRREERRRQPRSAQRRDRR